MKQVERETWRPSWGGVEDTPVQTWALTLPRELQPGWAVWGRGLRKSWRWASSSAPSLPKGQATTRQPERALGKDPHVQNLGGRTTLGPRYLYIHRLGTER